MPSKGTPAVGAGPCGAGTPARVPASPPTPTGDALVRPAVPATTRGPGSNDSNPRPKARRFSTFSFSPARPAVFSAAEVVINECPLSLCLPPLHPVSSSGPDVRARRIHATLPPYIDAHPYNTLMNIDIQKAAALKPSYPSPAPPQESPRRSLRVAQRPQWLSSVLTAES